MYVFVLLSVYRIFLVHTLSFLCVRIHTGFGHTDSESAQHFWLGKTHKLFVCSWRDSNVSPLDLDSNAVPVESPLGGPRTPTCFIFQELHLCDSESAQHFELGKTKVFLINASDGVQTSGHGILSLMLYQLSHPFTSHISGNPLPMLDLQLNAWWSVICEGLTYLKGWKEAGISDLRDL